MVQPHTSTTTCRHCSRRIGGCQWNNHSLVPHPADTAVGGQTVSGTTTHLYHTLQTLQLKDKLLSVQLHTRTTPYKHFSWKTDGQWYNYTPVPQYTDTSDRRQMVRGTTSHRYRPLQTLQLEDCQWYNHTSIAHHADPSVGR